MRIAVLGMLEFIDWGGGRYAAPAIVERHMHEGRIGLRTGQGFLDYANRDVDAYRPERLAAFVAMLGQLGLARPPVLEE